jgi:Family of unknown function (DUF6502)
LQLFQPLTGFVVDAGLSARDLHSILRQAAVRSVADRQLEVSRRVNISGIAATTGIPRAEISRILKLTPKKSHPLPDSWQQSTNRILAAWHQEPRFTDANGQPADLKLYGPGATFESLVRVHGRGIPTRAILDELVRTRVVDVLPSQRVHAKAALAVHRGLSPHAIKVFGERASELLSTMLFNMREPTSPRFLSTVFGTTVAAKMLPLVRRELSSRSAEFLAEIQENLNQGSRRGDGRRSKTVSVTVFCHESTTRKKDNPRHIPNNRRNFRRRR